MRATGQRFWNGCRSLEIKDVVQLTGTPGDGRETGRNSVRDRDSMTNRDPLGPARRMARFIADVVAAASVLPPFVWNDSAVRCRRRPKNRRCSGRLRVVGGK